MSSRSQLETLAGGNISSNLGVDYARLLRELDRDGLVRQLYRRAGLSLRRDLAILARTPRIAADPAARAYVATSVFDGNLKVPVLTLNGIGDPISSVVAQQAYAAAVQSAGRSAMLRQTYTASTGHCGFTPAEQVAAVQTLLQRIETGTWPRTDARAMQATAAATGLGESRYIDFRPPVFARRYTACDLQRDLQSTGAAPVRVATQSLPICRR